MSFWAKIENIKITNKNAFASACKELDLTVININEKFRGYDVTQKIIDNQSNIGYNYIYLTSAGEIVGDSDTRYSSMSARLGKNFGILKQRYLKYDIMYRAKRNGAIVSSIQENKDGSISMRIIQNG